IRAGCGSEVLISSGISGISAFRPPRLDLPGARQRKSATAQQSVPVTLGGTFYAYRAGRDRLAGPGRQRTGGPLARLTGEDVGTLPAVGAPRDVPGGSGSAACTSGASACW